MKKILSLCLALVMVLGMVAMTASAEGEIAFDGYYVSLGDDISLNFTLTGLTPGETYEVDVNGTKIAVVGAEDGTGVAKYTGLTPAMLDTKFTATLGEATATKSAMDYCKWALTNMSLSNDVHTLVVNLLDYAAAAQAYTGATVTANTWLNDLQKALAVAGDAAVNPYLETEDQDAMTFVWTNASLILGESVAYRFYFTTEVEPENFDLYRFEVTMDGVTTVIKAADAVAEAGGYYFDFTALTPADLRKDVTVVGMNINDVNTSRVKTFSAERYASWAATKDDLELNDLMAAILAYNKAAAEFNTVGETNAEHTVVYSYKDKSNLRDISTSALTANEIYRLSMLQGFWPSANNLPGSLVNTYAKVGVDISYISNSWTSGKQTLHWVYNYAVAKIIAGNAPNAGYENVKTMLVEGSCDGTTANLGNGENLDQNDVAMNNVGLTVADYQIGDAFLGRSKDSGYWTVIFLNRDENGVGRFIVINSSKRSFMLYLDADKTLADVTFTDYGTDINKFMGEAEYTYDATVYDNWQYYYVLRPNNLANQAN